MARKDSFFSTRFQSVVGYFGLSAAKKHMPVVAAEVDVRKVRVEEQEVKVSMLLMTNDRKHPKSPINLTVHLLHI